MPVWSTLLADFRIMSLFLVDLFSNHRYRSHYLFARISQLFFTKINKTAKIQSNLLIYGHNCQYGLLVLFTSESGQRFGRIGGIAIIILDAKYLIGNWVSRQHCFDCNKSKLTASHWSYTKILSFVRSLKLKQTYFTPSISLVHNICITRYNKQED